MFKKTGNTKHARIQNYFTFRGQSTFYLIIVYLQKKKKKKHSDSQIMIKTDIDDNNGNFMQ